MAGGSSSRFSPRGGGGPPAQPVVEGYHPLLGRLHPSVSTTRCHLSLQGRIGAAAILPLLLAACSAEPGSPSAGSTSAAAADDRIACALQGAPQFTRDCLVERAPNDGVLYLVVRHPDGAFRRFKVLKDGRGLAVADGADEAETSLSGNILEVTVGKDRYRFPATQKPHVPSS